MPLRQAQDHLVPGPEGEGLPSAQVPPDLALGRVFPKGQMAWLPHLDDPALGAPNECREAIFPLPLQFLMLPFKSRKSQTFFK